MNTKAFIFACCLHLARGLTKKAAPRQPNYHDTKYHVMTCKWLLCCAKSGSCNHFKYAVSHFIHGKKGGEKSTFQLILSLNMFFPLSNLSNASFLFAWHLVVCPPDGQSLGNSVTFSGTHNISNTFLCVWQYTRCWFVNNSDGEAICLGNLSKLTWTSRLTVETLLVV